MEKRLTLGLLLIAVVSANAEMKTSNDLKHIKVEDLTTQGAKSAVTSHGRVHEVQAALEDVLDALKSGDCDLAKTHAERAHKLAKRASKLTAASAQSKVDTEKAKGKTHPKYDKVKAANPHPDKK